MTDLHWKEQLEIILLQNRKEGTHLFTDNHGMLLNVVTRMGELKKRRISALIRQSALVSTHQRSLLSVYPHQQPSRKQLWLQNEP